MTLAALAGVLRRALTWSFDRLTIYAMSYPRVTMGVVLGLAALALIGWAL